MDGMPFTKAPTVGLISLFDPSAANDGALPKSRTLKVPAQLQGRAADEEVDDEDDQEYQSEQDRGLPPLQTIK